MMREVDSLLHPLQASRLARPSFSTRILQLRSHTHRWALLHSWRGKAYTASGQLMVSLNSACKLLHLRSGAEGIRTPDLRRAKSDPRYRHCSLVFKNTCKIADLILEVFVGVRSRSPGLVYYWCMEKDHRRYGYRAFATVPKRACNLGQPQGDVHTMVLLLSRCFSPSRSTFQPDLPSPFSWLPPQPVLPPYRRCLGYS
jgi:hypothetical protein